MNSQVFHVNKLGYVGTSHDIPYWISSVPRSYGFPSCQVLAEPDGDDPGRCAGQVATEAWYGWWHRGQEDPRLSKCRLNADYITTILILVIIMNYYTYI